MEKLETKLIGDSVLRETTVKVTTFCNPALHELIETLHKHMISDDLIGFAAPQIGESAAVFVSEIRETAVRKDPDTFDPFCAYINPEIIDVSRETELGWEGCGSIPWLFGKIERPSSAKIRFQDIQGEFHEKHCGGLLARVVQHEIDHLHGILFTDRADPKTLVSREWYIANILKR